METASDQYLLFALHGSLYAVKAQAIGATFRLPEITPVVEMPPQVVGVINLRGRIVPVLDLDILFGRPPARYGPDDGMVVIDTGGDMAGIVVNEVRDVIAIGEELIEPTSPRGEAVPPGLVAAKARVGDTIVMILDTDNLMSLRAPWAPPGGMPTAPGRPEDLAAEAAQEGGLSVRERGELHRRSLELMAGEEERGLPGAEQAAVLSLGGEYFGVDLKEVREFSPMSDLTPLPNCPDHVVGNMNLRGSILLVIDIRGLLGMPPGSYDRNSKVVVADCRGAAVGVSFDDILDVVRFNPGDLSRLPASVPPETERYALGACGYEGVAVTILNLREILGAESLTVGG